MASTAPRGRGRGRRTVSEINMVPFIDVMLVLLIIFMVTAPLIQPSMIDLPSIGKANQQPDIVVEVILRKNESIEVNGKPSSSAKTAVKATSVKKVALKELLTVVKAAQNQQTNAPVVISADKTVAYENVVKIMDTLQKGGITRVGLSVTLATP